MRKRSSTRVLRHAPWQRDLLVKIAKAIEHLVTVQCFVLMIIPPLGAASAKDSLVGSPHMMATPMAAVVLVAEALAEAVANQATVLAEDEVLAGRTIPLPTRAMDIRISATMPLRKLFARWMLLTFGK